MKHTWIAYPFMLGGFLLSLNSSRAQEASSTAFFETHIRPVLVEKCYECHSVETEINGGLALDSRPGWQRGGDSGVAIKPGDAQAGVLIKALEYTDSELKMPPDGQLPRDTIEKFKAWIAAGAVDPRDTEPVGKPKQVGLPVERAGEHWSYRPVAEPTVPARVDGFDPTNSIDAFLDAKLAEQGIELSAPATDRAILRRLTFDLHGLPPNEDQLASYESDTSLDKYERAVDRLLASPRFGERMARHWMDVARYAESVTLRGFVLPQAWRYRDYLISSFNSDRPIDLFIREQIAGDLMQDDDQAQRTQQLVATSFLAMGNTNLEEQDKEQLEMDYIDEQLEVIGRVFMGQTLGCARCHDHKFDPIPTRDYYALAGIFRSARPWNTRMFQVDRAFRCRFRPSKRQVRIAGKAARFDQGRRNEDRKSHRQTTASGKKGSVPATALAGIVIDDIDAQKVGQWKDSSTIGPFVGSGYVHDLNAGDSAKSITFEPKKLKPGNYSVRFAYTASANRTTKATIRVFSADGEKVLTINQQEPPTVDDLWVSLGNIDSSRMASASYWSPMKVPMGMWWPMRFNSCQ